MNSKPANPRTFRRLVLGGTIVPVAMAAAPFSATAGDVTSPLVIDDKSPIACPAPSTGWFGGVEATFMKMNRADGMRVDDNENTSVDADYEFAPRYTLGYLTGKGSGLRVRYWGDFQNTDLAHDPAERAQGNRLYAEAMAMDLEFFETISACGFDIELSAGLQYADYYEALYDFRQDLGVTVPESTKAVTGWGPVIGAELRRSFGKDTHFFARAKHSLLLADAQIMETSGPAFLDGANAGITELAFGLEHRRCIGNALVSFRGGYEWQQWHNFSYGFEDSDSSDDVSGPADSGFHGFTFGVGITGKGAASLAGSASSPAAFGDFAPGRGSGPVGLFGGFEATFLKYHRADGLRFDDNVDETADMDYEFAPRYTLGYRGECGPGIRARFWGDYESFGEANTPLNRADGDGVSADASTLDVEIFDSFALGSYDLNLSAGIQYAHFYEGLYDAFNPAAEMSKSVSGWGPVIGAELRRDLGGNNRFYGRARHSLLVADASVTDGGNDIAYLDGTTAGITEIAFGLEHQACIGNAAVTLRGGYEWQRWHNFSYGFEDTNSSDDPSGPADAGFHGFTVGVGITGKTSSTEHCAAGAKGAIEFPECDAGLFGGFEATFFKFSRADGMRFDDDIDASVDANYDFAPRYTLGYRTAGGPGFRARYWGDFENTSLPYDSARLAAADRLYAEANALDLEFFDTFSLCHFDLELSAGIQYADYYEASFDANDPAPESSKAVNGWGPVIGAELRRSFLDNSLVYARARHSLLLADAAITETSGPAFLDGSNAGITELALGLEHSLCVGGANVSLRGGYEWQRWHNFSYGFEDTNNSDDVSGPADGGFHGFTIGVGITR